MQRLFSSEKHDRSSSYREVDGTVDGQRRVSRWKRLPGVDELPRLTHIHTTVLLDVTVHITVNLHTNRTSRDYIETRMWANAQRDGRPAEYKWRPLFNAAKFGESSLTDLSS